ncbi:hypothetical protein BTVI_65785 [Pitangus sulphuratus]|nr:hypothetical protein BTVI_65785 [Pitangus sulphuratus]
MWGAMSNGSILLSMLLLLVATVAVPLATRLWQRLLATPETWKRPRSWARDSWSSQVHPRSPPAQVTPVQYPEAPGSSLYIPCGCGPTCSPCATASQELQDVVTPKWTREPFLLDSRACQALWEDLEKLVERGHLSCCGLSSSSGSPPRSGSPPPARRASIRRKAPARASAHPRTRRRWRSSVVPRTSGPRGSIPSQSLGDSCQTPGGRADTDRPQYPEAARIGRTCPGLTMHMARKNLELKLGAQPIPVRRSQEQVAQQEVSSRHRCPAHSLPAAAVVPYEKTVHAVLDTILQRERNVFPSPKHSLELAAKEQDKEYPSMSNTPGRSLHPFQSPCVTPYGGAPVGRSPCSFRAMGINRTHLAWKSLGIELGARATPAKPSQQQVAQREVSQGWQCPIHGSWGTVAVPYEKTLRAVLDKILQRERKLEHPYLQGALWRCLSRIGMKFVAAAQRLRRFLCAK